MKRRLQLSAQELEVLYGQEETGPIARRLIVNGFVEGDVDEFNELRDACADALASAGFDSSYEPNRIGKLLENLIDRLFIP